MEPTLDQLYCGLLVLGRKALRLFVPALLAVTVLTVVGGVPAGAEASATTNSGSTWTTQTVPSGTNYLNDIACPSTTTCYAVGASNSNSGAILATTNSGSTWTTQTVPSGTYYLKAIACPSTTTCYAVGENSSGSGGAIILATTNSGSTWTTQTVPSGTEFLYGIACPSATTCYAVGAIVIYYGSSAFDYGYILATTNSGSTWSAQTVPSGTSYLTAIACPSTTTCYAVGENSSYDGGTILATTNSGSTWSAQTVPSGTRFLNGIACTSTSTCYAVGQNSSLDGGIIFTTTNSGSTWSSQTVPSGTRSLFGVACPSARTCYAVGENSSSSGGIILVTTNSGSTWSTQTVPSGTALLSGIACTSTTACYAAGAGAGTVGGLILSSTTLSIITSVLIPSNGATLSGFTLLDASAENAASVEFRLFGGIYGYSGPVICNATATIFGWLCVWNTATVPDGSYVVLSEAFNSAGSTFSSGVSVTVHNPLPSTKVFVPSNGATLSGSTYLDATGQNASSVEFRLFGGIYGYSGPVICNATATIFGWLCVWNTATVPDGSYVVLSEAFNSAGSTFSSGVNITVDN